MSVSLLSNITTTMYELISLKQGKEKPSQFKHPWIFSGALEQVPKTVQNGSLVTVKDYDGNLVGVGTYTSRSMFAVRIFDFKDTEIDEKWFIEKFKEADAKRQLLGYGFSANTKTTVYRLIFGESDNIPGLVVDRYEDTFVIQISTLGTDLLRDLIIKALIKVFKPKCIVERSDMPSRKEEGVEPLIKIQYGKLGTDAKTLTAAKISSKSKSRSNIENQSQSKIPTNPPLIEFTENGYKFCADVLRGQKTGFFLDQKDLRKAIAPLSKDKKVLNLFSYSGSFGVIALKNKAKHVTNVDVSEEALALCERNAKLNKIPKTKYSTEKADVFQWLSTRKDPEFDMVIIDPPALIKSNKDKDDGIKAYHFLNRASLRLVKDNGIFVTSSCSHYLTDDDFSLILKKAGIQAGVTLSILAKITQSPDHPISLYFPESEYLKSYICLVSRAF